MSNAKSDESIGVTGREVPRHSLEIDLVVSLNLLKTERGLRKPRQPLWLWSTRRTSSRRRAPAMATPAGERATRRGPGQRRYFMARRGRGAGARGPAAAAPPAGRTARCPGPQPHAEIPGKAVVLLSGPQAEAFLLGELLFLFLSFFFFFTLVLLELDARAPYRRAGTGTVRDITQTRVSHHSGPSISRDF